MQRRRRVVGGVHQIAFALQTFLQAGAQALFVVHHQNFDLGIFHGHSFRLSGRVKHEHRPAAGRVFRVQIAAMRHRDLLRDPQAQAVAFRLGREIGIKNFAQFIRRNARPGVLHAQPEIIAGLARADLHLAAAADRLNAVDDQIQQRLRQPDRIRRHQRQVRLHRRENLDVCAGTLPAAAIRKRA